MTDKEQGFILLIFIIANGLSWLIGMDIETKDKIIIPNVMVICCMGIMFALKTMGVECFIIANGLSWLIGMGIETKDKIINPNVMVICCMGIMFALKMMGVE